MDDLSIWKTRKQKTEDADSRNVLNLSTLTWLEEVNPLTISKELLMECLDVAKLFKSYNSVLNESFLKKNHSHS